MGIYSTYVFPWILDRVMRQEPVRRQREKVVPRAGGDVLEIGVGSGLNLPFYDRVKVTRLRALDPSAELQRLARPRAEAAPVPVELLTASAEEIPLESASIDTVVITYTMCSIPQVDKALREMHRVLRPGGTLLFAEHGRAPDASVARWQNRLNPLWHWFSGGCNMNRPVPDLLGAAGFQLGEVETMYLPGPRVLTFNYWGIATR
ncbi:MAG TPA: class I SAM-dependent methyltransferase [Candidatus Binatia bacterium]|jgi:ubiquinone/menaquinone biosynthesis C-methylase UbiE